MNEYPPLSAADQLRTVVEAQLLHGLLKALPGICYTVDRNLVFTSSDGAGLEKLELKPGELVGCSLLELWGTQDQNYQPHASHLRVLQGEQATYRDVCKGRSFEYKLSPLRDDVGQICGVIGIGVDVTDQELARQQQAKLKAQLRHAQKTETIGRLAGGVAHDFNNLLTCIMGNLSLAESMLQPESELSQYLTEASVAAESAAGLTRQLLAFGRKQMIVPRPVALNTLVERMLGMLARLLGAEIKLTMNGATELWNVHADPSQLEQIVLNLVVNARDAVTHGGEVHLVTDNTVFVDSSADKPASLPAGDYVKLSVRDTGRGMSEGVLAQLFEPFFTTKDTGEGTGLGLAMVYGAVEQNRGAIEVDSTLGEGSIFSLYLPRCHEALRPVTQQTDAPASARGTETILLVEDERSLLELAECTLVQLGYRVLACSSADQALRVFDKQGRQVDLLLTDLVMPRMNGRELAARVTALNPAIAVLYSSGYGENMIAQRGVIGEGVNFLAKPYRISQLAEKVRSSLDAGAPHHVAQTTKNAAHSAMTPVT